MRIGKVLVKRSLPNVSQFHATTFTVSKNKTYRIYVDSCFRWERVLVVL